MPMFVFKKELQYELPFKLGIWEGLEGTSWVMQSLLFLMETRQPLNPLILVSHITYMHMHTYSYLAPVTIKNSPLKVLHLVDLL